MSASSVATIIALVASHFDVARRAIISPRRTEPLVTARHVAMWLARDMTTLSYPQIGRAFGDRDHTTIMNAARRIDRLMREDATFCRSVLGLKDDLSQQVAA